MGSHFILLSIQSPDRSLELNVVYPAAPKPRRLTCALLFASLSACGGAGSLTADAPAGVNLAGTWKLNRAVSDDPEKIYDKIRRQRAARYADPAPPPRHASPGTAGAQVPNSGGVSSSDTTESLSAEAEAAMIISTSKLNPFDMGVFGTIPRGDVITIKQRDQEMSISDGITDRSFTPGRKSVVSVPEGVADQHSGWKSRAYVIDVRAQAGPETIERYRLSEDGQHLLAEIQSTGGNMPSIKIKRVYDRLTALNVAPKND
jgi:hypothetical protein